MKFIFLFAAIFIFCIHGSIAQMPGESSRPSFIGIVSKDEPLWHQKLFEDESYRFVYQDFGKPEHRPVLYAYSKSRRRWLEIQKLSTAGADAPGSPPSVNYIGTPVKISDAAVTPSINWDGMKKRYVLEFGTSNVRKWRFLLVKEDLDRF